MADYQSALQQLIAQKQAAQPRPEDMQAAEEQNRLGLLLNQLFKSQAQVGNINGKPTESADVNFQDYGKLASDKMKQKNLLAQQNFDNGLQMQQAQMGAEKFASGQQADALSLQQGQQQLNQASQMNPLNLEAKKNDLLMQKQQIQQGGKNPNEVDRDLANLQRIQKIRDTAKLIEAGDPKKSAELNRNADILEAKYGSEKLTPGQKSVDTNYAKDYLEWTNSGKGIYEKNMARLEDAKKRLGNPGYGVSGNLIGRLPEVMRTEESRQIQQDVRAAAQASLRATLGAQFTEKEGERIMQFAYDPTLSAEANIAKIDAAINEIKSNADNQNAKAGQYEKAGSLKEYKSSAPTEQSASKSINGVEYIKVPGGWKKK